jgi:dissimilatory sulfite reductase (desulfoviridin) alpha/beta subunit
MPREICWEDKNVLIIGFIGLLGSWLTDELIGKKAKKMLSWESKYTLDNWLKKTIDWYTHFFQHYQQSESL